MSNHLIIKEKVVTMPEQIIYEGNSVKITTSRVVIGATSYQLCNISSIEVKSRFKKWVAFMAFIGAFSAAVMPIIAISASRFDLFLVYPLIGVSLLWLSFNIGFNDFFLYFDTSAGSISAYKGRKGDCFFLKDKIEEAMANR